MSRSPPRRKHHRHVHGVLLLDKPEGLTSNHVLQRVKYLMKAHKAGHTGSLDPLATGLLPICFGEASKVSSYLLNADKHYTTVARLGSTTDSADSTGEVLKTFSVPDLSREDVEQVLQRFRGEISQVPPIYSAIRKDGKRLYELARKGVDVEIPERQVTINRLALADMVEGALTLEVSCTKGTYIRSLVRDIGEVLGCGAHVEFLRRTGVDPFRHPKMTTFDEVLQLADENRLEERLLTVDEALVDMPALNISEHDSTRLKSGQRVRFDEPPEASFTLVRIYDHCGDFVGIGESNNAELKARRLMSTGT